MRYGYTLISNLDKDQFLLILDCGFCYETANTPMHEKCVTVHGKSCVK